jgi:soluble lytic murein transglycosylase
MRTIHLAAIALFAFAIALGFGVSALVGVVSRSTAVDVAPTAAPALAAPMDQASASAALDEAERARRALDPDRALAIVEPLAGHPDVGIAARAGLIAAVARLDAGRAGEAAESARAALGRNPDGEWRGRLLVALARTQKATNDCDGAIGSLDQARGTIDLGPYLDLLIADCAAQLGDRARQSQHAAAARSAADARTPRGEAIEHLLANALRSGNREEALGLAKELHETRFTRPGRAEALLQAGRVAAELGRRGEAGETLARVVIELGETASAAEALTKLNEIGEQGRVGPDHAAIVRQARGQHAEAEAALASAIEQGLPPERAAVARFQRGLALIQLGRNDEAIASFLRAADTLPGSPRAGLALLRAGRIHERAGRWVQAVEVYERAVKEVGTLPIGHEIQAQLVFALLQRGAVPEAIAAARDLDAKPADPAWKAFAWLWASKGYTRVHDVAGIDRALRSATVDGNRYGGLRATAILAGESRPANQPRAWSGVAPLTDDSRGAWLGSKGVDLGSVERELNESAGVRLMGELYGLGLRTYGDWESSELSARWHDKPGHLFELAARVADHGQHRFALRTANEGWRASGDQIPALPLAYQRLLYPIPFDDVVAAESTKRGLDPLLLAALVRKESIWDPLARSSANALGLAQVIPTTGQDIARALGRADFQQSDLLKPRVSLEFGAHYLAAQLRAFDGAIFPALAAYNAGGGNARRWLNELPADDSDIWAERIPFSETHTYVNNVYENYAHYRRIYAS